MIDAFGAVHGLSIDIEPHPINLFFSFPIMLHPNDPEAPSD